MRILWLPGGTVRAGIDRFPATILMHPAYSNSRTVNRALYIHYIAVLDRRQWLHRKQSKEVLSVTLWTPYMLRRQSILKPEIKDGFGDEELNK